MRSPRHNNRGDFFFARMKKTLDKGMDISVCLNRIQFVFTSTTGYTMTNQQISGHADIYARVDRKNKVAQMSNAEIAQMFEDLRFEMRERGLISFDESLSIMTVSRREVYKNC